VKAFHKLLGICDVTYVVTSTGAVGTDHNETYSRSHDAVIAYYDLPAIARTIKESENGRTVTICTDDCEMFQIDANAKTNDLWDAIVLFKAFLSKTSLDVAFRNANEALVKEVLDKRASKRCRANHNAEKIASCALITMSQTAGLKMTRIVYDEGNKCESRWSFSLPQQLLGEKCSKRANKPT